MARRTTFLDDEDRRSFLEIVGGLVEVGALEVFAFCLMPNHYHLLMRTPSGELARWMRHVNGDHVRRFNVRHRRVGPVWQGRYEAILVEDGEYLRECTRYIHLNPNRAKLTRPAQRCRWSSYRNYVGGPTVVGWVETGQVLAGFDDNRRRYRSYVESGRREKQISPFTRATAGLVLGGEEFVVQVRLKLRGRKSSVDEPALRELRRLGQKAPAQVEATVEQVFSQARPARLRRLKMYALRLHSRLRPSEITRRYGRTPGAVSRAAQQLAAEASRNRDLAAGLVAVAEALADQTSISKTKTKKDPGRKSQLETRSRQKPRRSWYATRVRCLPLIVASIAAGAGCGDRGVGACRASSDCAATEACAAGVCRQICMDRWDCTAAEDCRRGVCQPCLSCSGGGDSRSPGDGQFLGDALTSGDAAGGDAAGGGDALARGDGRVTGDAVTRGDAPPPGDTRQASDPRAPGDTNTCVPACGTRICGLDPVCGVSCGNCTTGVCDPAGQCVACNDGDLCDDGNPCTTGDQCDATATCAGSPAAAGAECGDATTTGCTDPDTCDGAGSCRPNDAPAGTGGACGTCSACDGSGSCAPVAAGSSGPGCSGGGTSCSDPDTCDGAGNCQRNDKPSGTNCGQGATECSNQDTCNGWGTCRKNHEPSGTNCGQGATQCSNQDTCDGSGTCRKNHKPSGTNCGQGATECSNQDTCNGSGTCRNNDKPSGTNCGAAQTACSRQDTCNGSGNCLPRDRLSGHNCGTCQECDGNGNCNSTGTPILCWADPDGDGYGADATFTDCGTCRAGAVPVGAWDCNNSDGNCYPGCGCSCGCASWCCP